MSCCLGKAVIRHLEDVLWPIVELIHPCEKFFLKFQKSKLHIDQEIYKGFSKILKGIMYSRSQSHMKENNLLFEREFGS